MDDDNNWDFENLDDEDENSEHAQKDNEDGSGDILHDDNGYERSLRQFYRFKNKISFQPPKEEDSRAPPFKDKLFTKEYDELVKNKKFNKTIKHSEDLEQGTLQTHRKKRKTGIIDGSSFRKEEFRKKAGCGNCRCMSNKTFFGHSQYQILLMFMIFDLVVLLGILVFHFRGTSNKLLSLPYNITSKRLFIDDIILNGASFPNLSHVGIVSRKELVFNSSVNVGEISISRENGVKCNQFVTYGSVNIGNIVFGTLDEKFAINTKDNILNIASHLTVNDVQVQNESNFGGIVFTKDGCENCLTDSPQLHSKLLESDEKNNLFRTIDFVPNYQYFNEDSTLIIGDRISYSCSNNDEFSCKEMPNFHENFDAKIFHSQKFFDGKILRICDRQSTEKVSLFINEKSLFDYGFLPQNAFIVPTFEDGKVIQILTEDKKIHIFKSNSIIINDHNFQNEEKIIESTNGKIIKLKALLNDFGDIVVFAQTEKGVETFRVFVSNFSMTPLKLQFPSITKFDASNRDSDLIVVAGVSGNGSVYVGRCFDDYCDKIKMIERKSLKTENAEFIGISLNGDDKPTISLSKNGITHVMNCKSFLCEDIREPIWS